MTEFDPKLEIQLVEPKTIKNIAVNSIQSNQIFTINIPEQPQPPTEQATQSQNDELQLTGVVQSVITDTDLRKSKNMQYLRQKNLASSVMEDQSDEYDADGAPKRSAKNIFFRLKLVQSDSKAKDRTVTCCSLVHFPVREHDAVFGEARPVIVEPVFDNYTRTQVHDGGIYYQFTYVPLGLTGTSKQAFHDNVAAFSLGKLVGKTIDELIEWLADNFTNQIKGEDEFKQKSAMSKIERAFTQLSTMAEEYRKIPSGELDGLINGISGGTAKTLLNRWYWYFLRRRLEILGLARSDISVMNKLGYEMSLIYEKVMKNSFTVLPLSIDAAIRLKILLGQSFTEREQEVAEVARQICSYVIRKGWSSVPRDDYVEYIEELKTDYSMIDSLGAIYFPQDHKVEQLVAGRMSTDSITATCFESEIIFSQNSQIKLTEEQQMAVTGALRNPISIITGGAGTGKTTIIEKIVENLERTQIPHAIVAFTGKAVSRIERGINSGKKPMTIHKLCYGGWDEEEQFRHLIIDEVSMLSIRLMADIYYRFIQPFSVTLVGDINQLPPIDRGNLFKEVLKSKIFPVFVLTKNLRIQTPVLPPPPKTANIPMNPVDATLIKLDPVQTDGIYINSSSILKIIELDRLTQEGLIFNIHQFSSSQIDYLNINNIGGQLEEDNKPILPGTNNHELAVVGYDHTTVADRSAILASSLRSVFQLQSSTNFKIWPGGLANVRICLNELVNDGVASSEVAIITPYNKHVGKLNNIAQDVFIIDKREFFTTNGMVFFNGDVLMMTKNDHAIGIMNGTTGEIRDFKYNERVVLTKRNQKNRSQQTRNETYGYVQVLFITGSNRRFLINSTDNMIYRWALQVALLSESNIGHKNKIKSSVNYPPNSEDEWKALCGVIADVRIYYDKYRDSATTFVNSPEYRNPSIVTMFEPLLRMKHRYGWIGDLTHGYAMTVHKSQGSEWKHVICYLDMNDRAHEFLNYHLIYTMITRAQYGIHCIGNIMLYMVSAKQPMCNRHDNLKKRLIIASEHPTSTHLHDV